MNPEQEQHQMVTEYEHNGTYWIVCPTCGRHVILLGGELAIIESGDQFAMHSWGTGGLVIGNVEVTQ